jgi:hypothetical protein
MPKEIGGLNKKISEFNLKHSFLDALRANSM